MHGRLADHVPEPPAEVAGSGVGPAGQVGHGERPVQALLRPGQQVGEGVVGGGLDGGGDELGLAAAPVGGHHEPPGDGVGDRGAVVEVDQVEAEVDGGGLARGRQHAAVVGVEHVGVDAGQGVARGEFGGVRPVGGGAAAVEEARGAEHEGSGAEGGDPGTGLVGRADGFDELRRGRLVDIGARGHDHGVGCGQVLQPVVGFHGEGADAHRPRPAEHDVVPARAASRGGLPKIS